MNIEEYISSGIVEAYVTGVATPAEVSEIERLMELHPELKAAVREQEDMLVRYAQLHAIVPPARLKQDIWKAVSGETLDEAQPVFAPSGDEDASRIIAIAPGRLRNTYLVAASIALLLTSGIANVWMMGQQKKMKEDMATLAASQKTLLEERNAALTSVQEVREMLQVLSLPSLKRINLAGVGSHTAHSGVLYWDGATGNVFLDLNSMPAAPEGKQYQLWAIVDGKPVDAGMYEASGAMPHRMKTIAKAEMFAVTIENTGGSPAPTLDQMVVAGKS